jgi:hypothetical protein
MRAMKPLRIHAARMVRACAAAIVMGCAVHEASAEATESFTLAGRFVPPAATAGDDSVFTDSIVWAVPLAEVAALFSLIPGGYDWSYPGLTVDVRVAPAERARVEAFAIAWMYVYRQPAVPYLRTPESGAPTMRLRYEANLVPAHLLHGEAESHGMLLAIRWLHPSPGIESRLAALRARYDAAVSRWLSRRGQSL